MDDIDSRGPSSPATQTTTTADLTPAPAAPRAGAGDPTATEDLGERECWELLRRESVGRLAVTREGAPDIFPVNYLVDHGSIVFRTASGTKLATAAGRPVAFEVDGHDATTGTAWSVVVRGVAHKILEREETLAALRLPLVPWQEGRKAWFVRVEPTAVTGRRLVLAPEARAALQRDGH